MTATTALTAQNTLGVVGIHYTPPDFVKKQIDACMSDVGTDVIKTGMHSGKLPTVLDLLKRVLSDFEDVEACWLPLIQSGSLQRLLNNIKSAPLS